MEAFGGEIPSVEVSGLTGQGLDQLVETISAVAEMSDLRAEMKGNVFGYVLDSKVVKGLGCSRNNDSALFPSNLTLSDLSQQFWCCEETLHPQRT